MSAERLREAARLMRKDNPPCCDVGDVCCESVTFHHAVADLLDVWADASLLESSGTLSAERAAILAIASAYLGDA